MKLYLAPYGTQKDFYGKAVVDFTDKGQVLYSYNTAVAMFDTKGKFHRLWDGYSATTQKHVNAFRQHAHHTALTKKEWLSLAVE